MIELAAILGALVVAAQAVANVVLLFERRRLRQQLACAQVEAQALRICYGRPSLRVVR